MEHTVSETTGPSAIEGRMKIIGFAGLARSGKTESCNLMERWAKKNGYRTIRMSFAGPLKDALKRAGITKEDSPKQYREIAQKWGANRRDPEYRPGVTGPDYWVRKVAKKICSIAESEHLNYLKADSTIGLSGWKETLVLFDDVRYENECQMIKAMNGTMVFVSAWDRLFRNGNKDEWVEGSWRWHESEQMAIEFEVGVLDDIWFDYVLVNDGSAQRLAKSVPHYAPVWIDNSDIHSTVIMSEGD
jgi:hypothetical protein